MNLRDLTLRVRALLFPNRAERDLADELQFHIERETRKLIEEGVSAGEARVQARARFGSVTVTADECRDERGTAFIDNTIAAARTVGARILLPGTIYNFDPATTPVIREGSPTVDGSSSSTRSVEAAASGCVLSITTIIGLAFPPAIRLSMIVGARPSISQPVSSFDVR